MSHSLKVAFVRADFDPYGGAERFTQVLMHELAQRGVEVHIFARSWTKGGVADYSIHRVGGLSSPSLLRHASFVWGVRRALAKEHFDLIQSNERTLSQTIYRAGDGVHARWLELRSERVGLARRLSLTLNPFHRYICWLERRMFESPMLSAIIVNSEMVRKEITDRFSVADSKIHTIYNGVDLQRFHPSHKHQQGLAVRQAAGITPQTPVALFVGSGYERKGLSQLLTAMAAMDKSMQLWVVGKDSLKPYKKMAERLGIGGLVRFLGRQDDVQPYYAAADFFVLPTVYDPFPSVALEAMASGLPIIVSKQCGAAEVIKSGREGYVLDSPEDQNFSRYLDLLVESTQSMSSAARQCAEKFPISKTVQETISLYHHILGIPQ